MRDALRNRWFLLYTISFVALSLAFSYMAMAGTGIVGFAGFGRTAASLINLVLLITPLMALTIGIHSLVGEQEHGTLAHLLAQPINRAEVFLGKYLGLSLSLLASLALGFRHLGRRNGAEQQRSERSCDIHSAGRACLSPEPGHAQHRLPAFRADEP